MRSLRRIALAAGVAIALAGCLPASVRPTGTPGPTPTPVATPRPTPTPTPGPPTPTPGPTFALVTVVRGDSLTSLATRFRTTPRSIAYWNRDAHPTLDPESTAYNPDLLGVGWVLRILPGQEYTQPMGPGESPDPTETPMASPSGPDAGSPVPSPAAPTGG